jgi:hypothetical protein
MIIFIIDNKLESKFIRTKIGTEFYNEDEIKELETRLIYDFSK